MKAVKKHRTFELPGFVRIVKIKIEQQTDIAFQWCQFCFLEFYPYENFSCFFGDYGV